MANKIIQTGFDEAIVVDSAGSLSIEGEDGENMWSLRINLLGASSPCFVLLPGIQTRHEARRVLAQLLAWMTDSDGVHIISIARWCEEVLKYSKT